MQFTFWREKDLSQSKYIRHGMLSEVNKCFGEKSRAGVRHGKCGKRGLDFTYGVWKGPTMVTFKQKCKIWGEWPTESLLDFSLGHSVEKFPGREKKEPWGLLGLQTQWVKRKPYWKEGKGHGILVQWARSCKGFSFYSGMKWKVIDSVIIWHLQRPLATMFE